MYLNIASREEQEPTIRLPRNSRQKKKKDGEDEMERTGGRQTYPGSKGKTAAQQKTVNESAPGSIIYSKV